jgi:alpha-beta hydrolase superfamily lysophospholipase
MPMRSFDLLIPSNVRLDGEPSLHSAATVFLPALPGAASAALVCLAGGNMNRRYFDLQVEGDDSFSFAAQMTARGFIVVAIDHLGLGDSSRPADGYALTPSVLAQANAHATADVLARIREGRLAPDVCAMPSLRSLGVGHSMGAMLTILQQAGAHQHAGVALLGFSTRGLPKFVPDDVRALAAEPVALRARLVEFARRMFGVPYPRIRTSGGKHTELYGSDAADPRGVAALKAATDCLLPVPALLSMIPGNVAPEAADIDVPVFLGLGERDMAGPPVEAPRAFTSSPEVRLEVFAGAGHSHFLFASRVDLFDRLAAWSASLP